MKQYYLEELRKKLLTISSLSTKERSIIFNELKKYSIGGISYNELSKVIYNLRKKYKISDIDQKNLKKLLVYLK